MNTVDFDTSYLLKAAAGARPTFGQPPCYAFRVVLMSAEELCVGFFIKANGAGII